MLNNSGAALSGTVLIIDDEVVLARRLAQILRSHGYQTDVAATGAEGRAKMETLFPDVVLMDMQLPDADGNDLVAELNKRFPQSSFIIITGHGSVHSAVEAMKRGAVDYLSKPFDIDEMTFAVREALARRHMADELSTLRAHSPVTESEPPSWPSAAMRQVMTLAERAAKRTSVVLLLGESGTGKNWLARFIHRHSPRAEGPYFTVNCATVSRDLAESEMFGHEPGAFTGSRGRKRGLMELADGGTLVLDEIGDMDPSLQAKLLTFLDTQTFVRVGGEESIRIDTRIFACTNVDIEARVKSGGFRQDLFYRLNVLPIRLPPLRERVEDLPILATHLLNRLSAELRMSPAAVLTADAEARLGSYPWPGNIRELRNVLERALILSHDGQIRAEDLPLPHDGRPLEWCLQVRFPENLSLHAVTADVARNLVREALRRAGTKQEAAALLGLTRHALAHQMKALGLEEDRDQA